MSKMIYSRPVDADGKVPAPGDQHGSQEDSDEFARQQAIRQIERRRRFTISTAATAVGAIILVAIWATSEYHNAGGWPTRGFSQSSGVHDVWNFWIIYPLIAMVLATAGHAWFVYGRKPISETEVRREIERQAGERR
jgi:phosphate/sulfate permease